MSQLLTQCPFCQTSFKVTDKQMQVANGVVRCGVCMEVFLARKNRIVLKDRPDYSGSTLADRFDAWHDDAPEPAPPEPAPAPETATETPDSALREDRVDPWLDAGLDRGDGQQGDQLEDFSETDAAFGAPDDDATDEDIYPEQAADNETGHGTDVHDDDALQGLESGENTAADHFTEADTAQELDDESGESREKDSQGEEDTHSAAASAAKSTAENAAELQGNTDDSAPAPFFGGSLDPSGYSLQRFEASCEPPAIALQTAAPDDEAHPFAVEDQVPALTSTEASTEEAVNALLPAEPDDLAADEEDANEAAARSSDITPQSRIPTLTPDVVASESIPASLGTQTLAWFRSLRNPAAEPEVVMSGPVDEKARYRQQLTTLQHEDSLDPLDEEGFAAINDVIDDEPVELLSEDARHRQLKILGMAALSVLLVVLLAGQALWSNMPTLLANGRLSSVTGLLCSLLDCPTPQTINLSELVTEELNVRTHPDVQDALQVNFIFRNDAQREQLFPDVQLTFTDNSGRIVAGRVFSSAQYLPAEMQLFTHMPAHSSIQISMDVDDPGATATGYSLEFRNP